MADTAAVAVTVVPSTDATSPIANVAPAAQAQTSPSSSTATGSLGSGGNFMVQLRQILEFINGLLRIFNGGGAPLPSIPGTSGGTFRTELSTSMARPAPRS